MFYKLANTPGNSSRSKQKGCFGLQAYNMLIQFRGIKSEKLSKYSGSFIKHSAFSRKTGLSSETGSQALPKAQNAAIILPNQWRCHHFPWAAFYSLVDLSTRKITLKFQVEIQSVFFAFFSLPLQINAKYSYNHQHWVIGFCTPGT